MHRRIQIVGGEEPFDFGKIMNKSEKVVDLHVSSNANEPLRLQATASDRGGTVAGLEPENVAAHARSDSLRLRVAFTTTAQAGEHKSQITITSRDPDVKVNGGIIQVSWVQPSAWDVLFPFIVFALIVILLAVAAFYVWWLRQPSAATGTLQLWKIGGERIDDLGLMELKNARRSHWRKMLHKSQLTLGTSGEVRIRETCSGVKRVHCRIDARREQGTVHWYITRVAPMERIETEDHPGEELDAATVATSMDSVEVEEAVRNWVLLKPDNTVELLDGLVLEFGVDKLSSTFQYWNSRAVPKAPDYGETLDNFGWSFGETENYSEISKHGASLPSMDDLPRSGTGQSSGMRLPEGWADATMEVTRPSQSGRQSPRASAPPIEEDAPEARGGEDTSQARYEGPDVSVGGDSDWSRTRPPL